MRKTIEEVETNMAYRWFLGYGHLISQRSGKNYERRFKKGILGPEFLIPDPFCLQTETKDRSSLSFSFHTFKPMLQSCS
ncbi:hypothetical protein [Peribacillus frigoritolerans]|uniref:hypothetical protein n=1 Tax=Peribacillus frigoritolerans TaxID=450367 RepID=UPI00399C52D2